MKRDVAALAAVEHDLLVIGGGIYGVTAAYEAAARGLRVALVEAEDFGAGASWNSFKTIHGGLRHLQRLDLASHRESVRERRLLLRLAPAIVRPLRFLVPAEGHGLRGREAMAVGLLLDNLLALDRNEALPREQRLAEGRMLDRGAALAFVPGLPAANLTGAAVWEDAQVDSPERLIVGFLRAAAKSGAMAANHCRAVAWLEGGGRIVGARVRDGETGDEHELRARFVVNTAGPGADALFGPHLGVPACARLEALNLVFDGPWPLAERLAVGARSGGRALFLAPWRDRILAGTDYRPSGTPAGAEAVEAFRREADAAFPWAGLGARALSLVHRGLVPGEGGALGLALRPTIVDHETTGGPAGLVSVHGVKYTTARAVTERVVGLAAARLSGDGARRGGQPAETPGRPDLLPLEWARPLPGSLADRARAAARDEMARTLADAMLRRLDLGTAGPPPGAEIDEAAQVLGQELGWDGGRARAEKQALARFYEDAYNGTRSPS